MPVDKYDKAVLPTSIAEALKMAGVREEWASAARIMDRNGTAYEFELSALLLRQYATHLSVRNASGVIL